MAPRRTRAPSGIVTLQVDGKPVPAVEGEPVAVALTAAGRLLLGRSVKYHRPRGAFCYQGRCDGCLMRVDGVPNVMTCRLPAAEGLVVESQNVVGSVDADFLAATDWFYPSGMDHHHMFTRFGPVNRLMQKIARRIAGIGTLPDAPLEPRKPTLAACDLLVVGGGPAGLAAATEAAREGRDVLLVDEAEAPGGHLLLWPEHVDAGGAADRAPEVAGWLADGARAAGVRLLASTSAVGVYADEVRPGAHLVALDGPTGLTVVRPRRLVVATGDEEGPLPVEGGEHPGVVTARGALTLLRHGVLPGERAIVAGGGRWADPVAGALARAGAWVLGPLAAEAVTAVVGAKRVEAVDVVEGGKRKRHECDVLVLADTPSAVHEIALQAGARPRFDGRRFLVVAGLEDGATASPTVRAVGHCTHDVPLEALLAQARAAGRAAARELDE